MPEPEALPPPPGGGGGGGLVDAITVGSTLHYSRTSMHTEQYSTVPAQHDPAVASDEGGLDHHSIPGRENRPIRVRRFVSYCL